MNRIREQPLNSSSQMRNSAHFIEKLDNWLTCHNLTKLFLVITNFSLSLKSLSNLVAVFNDSDSLIVDYNGVILLSDGFRWCFILMNIGVLFGSYMCLMALLFVVKPKTKLKLLKCFVITQPVLALATLILMARLWFVPFKLGLDSEAWKWTIKKYDYQFKLDANGLWPNGLPLRVRDPIQLQEGYELNRDAYNYRNKVDRLQQAIGCCGVWSPNEWRQNELLGLLAPSCCSNPTRIDVDFPVDINLGSNNTETQSNLAFNTKQIFYCQWGHNEASGCQQLLNERATNFLFRIRLTLLLLIGILFLNLMSRAFLKFNPQNDSRQVVRTEQCLASNPPPSYEQSRIFYVGQTNAKNPPSYQQTFDSFVIAY